MQNILKNIIRIGRVSKVIQERGAVEVTFEDKDDIVTEELPFLAYEYYMPNVKDLVLCVFLPNGVETGFCLGRFFNDTFPAFTDNKDIYFKDFFGDANLQYDKEEETLTINAKKIVFNTENLFVNGNIWVKGNIVTTNGGNMTCAGNIDIDGTIEATGTITSGDRITGDEVHDSIGNVRE